MYSPNSDLNLVREPKLWNYGYSGISVIAWRTNFIYLTSKFDINLENNKECVIDVEKRRQMALGVRIARNCVIN
jgi:hypothetical protein